MRLEGKVAIVTGAAKGFGRAFCLRLAQEGAKVVAADIVDASGTVAEIEAEGGVGLALKVDVTSEEDTLRMAEETVEKFGRIDILISNAAALYGIKIVPFYEIEIGEWDRLMAVNVKGQWLCARAVFPQMKKQGKGKIINMGSTSFIGAAGLFAHYITSKAAIIGLTRALARELGDYNINVNTLAPGFTMTEAGHLLRAQGIGSKATGRCFKRDEQPEDVLGAMVFLCSEDSDFMTGQTVVVDGGGSFL
jgi:NAD(P)-dependent dehydrogenase (short-subunit alcohol dehydrogenase family)